MNDIFALLASAVSSTVASSAAAAVAAATAASVPVALAGVGGLATELSGSLAVFLEGFMTLGSFFAWALFRTTGSVPAAAAAAAAICGFLGWLLARFVRSSGANPFIAGLALNLAAVGTTEALSSAWYGTKGVLADPASGAIRSTRLPFILLTLVIVAFAAFIAKRTRLGLRLRAAGRAPETLAERGTDARLYREGAWAFAAAVAALAGASLTFRIGAYAPGGTAGRGWIALAAVYLGFRNAWGVALAALVFALAEQAASFAQGSGGLSATALLGLPSAMALVLYSASAGLRSFRERRAEGGEDAKNRGASRR
ncbi:MAG: hypothetical protein A2Y36_06675 [Treponema sp. GWA1_62_8]|nr:MAG: hypothetical protein A2Y36_06675 [Treponema sp. GWA1_62_8]